MSGLLYCIKPGDFRLRLYEKMRVLISFPFGFADVVKIP